jgi:hypothetical protein
MLFIPLMLLKETFIAVPYWIQLVCAFPLGPSGTIPCSTFSVRRNFKASSSVKYVYASIVVCRNMYRVYSCIFLFSVSFLLCACL